MELDLENSGAPVPVVAPESLTYWGSGPYVIGGSGWYPGPCSPKIV